MSNKNTQLPPLPGATHLFEGKNYKIFRVAFLHNKFWTSNSILVPDRLPEYKNFQEVTSIFHDQLGKDHTIFWSEPEVLGECLLPGEWNYAIIDGDYYHLEKKKSFGKIPGYEGIRFYIYTVIYDDWTSDWLNNRIYLEGSINLTGDKELVKQHIFQTNPLIENVNRFRILNSVRKEGHPETKFIQADRSKFKKSSLISSWDYVILRDELKKLKLDEPNPDKLVLPLVYKATGEGDWRWNILKSIEKLIEGGFYIYDFDKSDTKNRDAFERALRSTEVYVVASRQNKTFHYAKSVNPTKYLDLVDLSKCVDLVELDPLTLTPKTETPNFSIDKFINDVINRYSLRSKSWFTGEVEAKYRSKILDKVADLYSTVTIYKDNKYVGFSEVFKNVEIEAIDRKTTPDTPTGFNPKSREIFNSWFPFLKFHKNLIFDTPLDNQKIMLRPRDGAFMGEEGEKILEQFIQGFYNTTYKEQISFFINGVDHWDYRNNSKLKVQDYFDIVEFDHDVDLSLVIETDKFKLKCDGCVNELDWSRDASPDDVYIALIPDYKRKTHVLSIGRFLDTNLKWSDEDSKVKYPGRVKVLVFNELTEVSSINKVNFRNPSDFMVEYNKIWSDAGFSFEKSLSSGRILSNLLFNGYWEIKYKYYSSACNGKTWCDWSEWGDDDYRIRSYDKRAGSAKYHLAANEWVNDTRRYHLQFQFPLTFGNVDIVEHFLAPLLYRNVYPDGRHVAWRIINAPKNKFPITVLRKSHFGNNKWKPWGLDPETGQFKLFESNEYEGEYDPNKPTIVHIWLYLFEGYTIDRGGQVTYKVNESASKFAQILFTYWFKIKWNDNTIGGIPNWFGSVRDDKYRNPQEGTSIIQLRWVKPYQGHYYTVTAEINSLDPYIKAHDWMKFGDSGAFDFDNHKDWLVSIVPDRLSITRPQEVKVIGVPMGVSTYTIDRIGDTEAFKATPTYSFRESTKNMSIPAELALLFNGYNAEVDDEGSVGQGLFRNYSNIDTKEWSGRIVYNPTDGDWARANRWRDDYEAILNLNNTKHILWWDLYTHKTLKHNKTDNPTELKPEYFRIKSLDSYTESDTLRLNNLNREVPYWLASYFDVNNHVKCEAFHRWDNIPNNESEFFRELDKRLDKHFKATFQLLGIDNHIFELKGTDWIVSITLNTTQDKPFWDFELFSKDLSVFKNISDSKYNFSSTGDSDVDVIINTTNELNVHGKRIPIKTKIVNGDDEVDLGLKIQPIHDQKQTEIATYYKVWTDNRDIEDVIWTTLEVPKEIVKSTDFDIYQQERLNRQININAADMESEMRLFELEKSKYNMSHEIDVGEFGYDTAMGLIRGAVDIFTPAKKMSYSKAALIQQQKAWDDMSEKRGSRPEWGGIKSLIHNVPIVGGALNMIDTIAGASFEGERMKINHKYTLDRFSIRGELLNRSHNHKKADDHNELLKLSNKVNYPQMNSQLIYKEFNRMSNITDIYMFQKYPAGKLLEYIKEYYKQYGYNIFVRDFKCYGIMSIKRHLRFISITFNQYRNENEWRKRLIEERALNGIKVIEWL